MHVYVYPAELRAVKEFLGSCAGAQRDDGFYLGFWDANGKGWKKGIVVL